MQVVLLLGHQTGPTFRIQGGRTAIFVDSHVANTTIQLQVSHPDKTEWVDDEVVFTGNGIKFFYASSFLKYRVRGSAASVGNVYVERAILAE